MPGAHLVSIRQHKAAQRIDILRQGSFSHVHDILGEEHAQLAFSVLSISHAAKGSVVVASMRAHCVLQVILG